MRSLFLALLLLPAVALGQGRPAPGTITGEPAVGLSQLQTTADKTYYVDPSGNDNNACTSATVGACLTLQGAWNKIPGEVKHVVTINVAAGTYGGAVLDGKRIRQSSTAVANSINIVCTLSAAVPTTGNASGTLTSVSAASGSTLGILNDTNSGTWTSNDFQDRFVRIVTGTGATATSIFPIASNTTTAITYVGSTTATTGSTYEILGRGSIFNTAIPADVGPLSITNGPAAMFKINDNITEGNFGNAFTIQRCAFTTAGNSTTGIMVEGPQRIYTRWNIYENTAGTFDRGVFVNRNAGIQIVASIFKHTSSSTAIDMGNTTSYAGGVLVSGTFFDAGATGINIRTPIFTISSSYFSAQTTTAIEITQGFVGSGTITSTRINGAVNGIRFTSTAAGPGSAALGIGSTTISNATTALSLSSPSVQAYATSLAGTTNTTGIVLNKGAKLQVDSASTLTGTAEVTVDGTGTDYATMRALTPKAYPAVASPYGTAFYE